MLEHKFYAQGHRPAQQGPLQVGTQRIIAGGARPKKPASGESENQ